MPQIDDFFIDKNRVDGITEEDYERVQPKIEAVAAAARTTTNSIKGGTGHVARNQPCGF